MLTDEQLTAFWTVLPELSDTLQANIKACDLINSRDNTCRSCIFFLNDKISTEYACTLDAIDNPDFADLISWLKPQIEQRKLTHPEEFI